MAAVAGGSDETSALRLLFQHEDGSNRHAVALAGLALILLMTIPVLLRAFFLLPGWIEKLFLFPVFLILPMYTERWILGAMNSLYLKGILSNFVLPGTPLLVVVWTIFLLIIFALTYKNLLIFEYSIQNRRAFKSQ